MEKEHQGEIGPESHRYEGQEARRLPAVPPWVSLTCEHSVSPSPSPRRGRRLGRGRQSCRGYSRKWCWPWEEWEGLEGQRGGGAVSLVTTLLLHHAEQLRAFLFP